ncbi:MAG: hypothetical protein RBT25_04800 [Lentisphaeria bacterium]|nr:hypothetical protein [Lentisphaeria bacterium]
MKIPFITAQSGHSTLVDKASLVFPEALAAIQDIYPNGGDLPPYFHVKFEIGKTHILVPISSQAEREQPVCELVVAWGKSSKYWYKKLVPEKKQDGFDGETPVIIANLNNRIKFLPIDGIVMLGDLEKVIAIFLLDLHQPSLWA